jgi:FKBP-type peptidyl-prolyl cis-trans isomerase FkpA
MEIMRRLPFVCAFLIAGCKASDQSTPAGSVGAPAASASIESATFAPALNVDLTASTKTASGLYYRDLTVGTGPEVATGQQVSVHYGGWLPNGALFDENVVGQPPLTFTPGAGGVIDGWEEGVVGMRVGGKRQLILPPALGYGAGGSGPIPPNAILVFTVEVVGVR